jgi:hypothetical protein
LSPMWREGATSGDIATTMDMSRGAVMGKLRQLGLLARGGHQTQCTVAATATAGTDPWAGGAGVMARRA